MGSSDLNPHLDPLKVLVHALDQSGICSSHGVDPREVAWVAMGSVTGTLPEGQVPSVELRLVAILLRCSFEDAALKLCAVALLDAGWLSDPEEGRS